MWMHLIGRIAVSGSFAVLAGCESDGDRSKGAASMLDLPPQSMTLPDFLEANHDKGLTLDQLKRRFQVADENGDGELTRVEVLRHRWEASRKKKLKRG